MLWRPGIVLLVAFGLLAACNPRPQGTVVHDPYETVNRAWFERNLALDSAIGSDRSDDEAEPAAPGGNVLQQRVRHFGSNLSHPGYVVNNVLQLRPDRAMHNFFRFAINSTIGIGGLFDPAASVGLIARPTDFGETMHRWGANEGAYVVLPVIGPSTERDAAGMVVNIFLDPLRYVLPGRERVGATGARLAGRIADRQAFGDIIDANVMRSEDPYAQARLLFLQARRHHLGMDSEDDFIDPYADFPD